MRQRCRHGMMEARVTTRGSPRKANLLNKSSTLPLASSDTEFMQTLSACKKEEEEQQQQQQQPPVRQSKRLASAPNLQVASLVNNELIPQGPTSRPSSPRPSRSSSPRPSRSNSPRPEGLDLSVESDESGNVRRRSSRLLNAVKVEETNNNEDAKVSEISKPVKSIKVRYPEVKIVVHGAGEPMEVQSGISEETHSVVMLNKCIENKANGNKMNTKPIMAPAAICQALRAKLATKAKPQPVKIEKEEDSGSGSDHVLGTLQLDGEDLTEDPELSASELRQRWKEISQLEDLSYVRSVIKIIGYANSQPSLNNNDNECEMYQCNFCDKEVEVKELLLQHVETVHTIKCPHCSYLDFTRSGILSHCKLLHAEMNDWEKFPILVSDSRWLPHARPAFTKPSMDKWSVAGEVLPRRSSSQDKSAANFRCSYCKKSAATSFQIIQHIKKAHPGQTVRVVCPDGKNVPDRTPEKSRKIAVARRGIPSSDQVIPIIKKCGKLTSAAVAEMSKNAVVVLATPDDIPKELQEVSTKYKSSANGNTYRCLKCSFREPCRSKMQRHVLDKHCKAKVWSCPHCSYEARKKYQLIVHLLVKHVGEQFKVIRRLPYSDHPSAASRQADTSTSKTLASSPTKVHPKPAEKLKTPEKPPSTATPAKNADVAKTYLTPDGLEVKILLAENMSTELINIHTSYHRLSSGMFRCKKCSVKKDDKWKIEDHVRIHFSTKVWTCGHCDIGKSKKLEVIAHIRKHHPDKDLLVIRNMPYAATVQTSSPKKENDTSELSKKKENISEPNKTSTSKQNVQKPEAVSKKRSLETPTNGLKRLKTIERNNRKIELLLTKKVAPKLGNFSSNFKMENASDRACTCEICGIRKDRKDRMERHIMSKHFPDYFIWHCAHCQEKFNPILLAAQHVVESHDHENLKLIRQIPYSASTMKESKPSVETEAKKVEKKKVTKKASSSIVTTEIHRTVSTAEIVMMSEIPLNWTMDVSKYYTYCNFLPG